VAYDCHQPSFQLTLICVNAVLITSPELGHRQGVKLRMSFMSTSMFQNLIGLGESANELILKGTYHLQFVFPGPRICPAK
jgi:hypothetical protein